MSNIHRTKQAEKNQTESNTESRPTHLLAWLRAFFGPMVCIGGWGAIPANYLIGVSIVYAGLAFAFFEIVYDPFINRKSIPIQISSLALVLFFLDWFTIAFVAAAAPINFTSFQTDINYTAGNGPAGISWEPFFAELDFLVTNPSDSNYDNLDLLVRPDFPVVKIAQQSNLEGVSFEDRYGMNVRGTIEESGSQPQVPLIFLGTNAGYKVHCPSIPPNSSLSLVMAIADFKKTKPEDSGRPFNVPPGADMSQFLLSPTVTDKEGTFNYWFGTAVNKLHYLPKPTLKKVYVEISYTASYRRRKKTLEVPVDQWKRQ